MKLLLLAIALSSCGAFTRTMTGTTVDAARKQASLEYNCPIESVKLIEKSQRSGGATYVLDVCGTRRVYNQVGSTLQEKK